MDDLLSSLAAAACEIVEDLVGAAPLHVEPLDLGVMNHKVVVTIASGERLLVRFYPANRGHVVRYEPDVIKRCARKGMTVPSLIADSRDGPLAPLEWILYQMLPGTPLSTNWESLSSAQQQRLAADLVEQLLKLQLVDVTGYGELVEGTRASHASWPEFLSEVFSQGLRAIRTTAMGLRLERVLLEIERSLPGLVDATPPRLIWGDLSLENILVDGRGQLTGLVDFEGVLSGNALFTLGYCWASYGGHAFFRAIETAWPSPLNSEDWTQVELGAVVRALRLARYADSPLPTGRARMPLLQVLPCVEEAVHRLKRRLDSPRRDVVT